MRNLQGYLVVVRSTCASVAKGFLQKGALPDGADVLGEVCIRVASYVEKNPADRDNEKFIRFTAHREAKREYLRLFRVRP